MKDLDFDELDRAVNSLMTDASKAQPDEPAAEPGEQEKTLDITPTLSGNTAPSFDKLNEETAKTAGTVGSDAPAPDKKTEEEVSLAAESPATPPPTPVPARSAGSTPPAARRGGRFMDVVHPSADMKKADAPARVSRQGVTITPMNTVPSQDPAPETEEEPQPSVPPSEAPQPKPAEPEIEKPMPLAIPSQPPAKTHAAAKSDWPDPLEIADFKGEKDESKPVESTPDDEKGASGSEAPEDKAETKEERSQPPLTSPFLSDAKVEKRPLGSSAVPAEAEEPGRAPMLGAASEEKKSIDDPAAQLPASPEEVELELPEELQGDLVAIEADTTTHPQPAPATPEPATEEKKASDMPAPEERTSPQPPQPARDQDEKLLSAGPSSIPQQYREEPSTGDKDNGAIYDTDTYHQPLAHPAKKKSGWLAVVWVAAILLLGAGGGAALYLSGIL